MYNFTYSLVDKAIVEGFFYWRGGGGGSGHANRFAVWNEDRGVRMGRLGTE